MGRKTDIPLPIEEISTGLLNGLLVPSAGRFPPSSAGIPRAVRFCDSHQAWELTDVDIISK